MPKLNEQPKRALARRDYVLLPVICVLTVLVMFVVSEMGTRFVWPAARAGQECHMEDAALGMVNVPNCTMRIKVPETAWITYHYNECGFRSTEACGPKPPGTRRVAVLGTSFAEGTSVAYRDSFGALSAAQLTRICHGLVEFQNLGVYDLFSVNSATTFLSWAFSSRSCFSCRTWPVCSPAYSFFQRKKVCSEMPTWRIGSANGMPASACFNTATICLTLKRSRFIVRFLSHRKVRRKLAYIMALFTGSRSFAHPSSSVLTRFANGVRIKHCRSDVLSGDP
jgi:hypothetical protein